MSPEEEAQLYTTDTYTFDEADKSFFVAGKSFTAKQLADALHTLPEEKRKAVLLYYFFDMTDAQIAQHLNIPRSTVSMLSRMQAKGLSAGYNGETVFRGLDLKIPEGSITTLIGSNGSGKSTILKTLCRIISPDSGAVYLDGEAIHEMPTKRVAQRLALLPQGAQAPAGITVGDLVEYGRFPYRSALSGIGEKDREIIQWALASTGMGLLEHREMERLSGGQQQRAWIAMALAQKTGLLFLDEPTTYLDISHQLDILYLLRRLNQENGVTIVMVLHDLNHAIMFSDYLVAIKDGILHSAGTPQEVITQQALREIFDVEAEVITHPVLNVPVCLPFRITEQNKKQEVRTHEKGAAISAVLRAGGCAAAVRRMRQIGRHLHGGRLYGFR